MRVFDSVYCSESLFGTLFMNTVHEVFKKIKKIKSNKIKSFKMKISKIKFLLLKMIYCGIIVLHFI